MGITNAKAMKIKHNSYIHINSTNNAFNGVLSNRSILIDTCNMNKFHFKQYTFDNLR